MFVDLFQKYFEYQIKLFLANLKLNILVWQFLHIWLC